MPNVKVDGIQLTQFTFFPYLADVWDWEPQILC